DAVGKVGQSICSRIPNYPKPRAPTSSSSYPQPSPTSGPSLGPGSSNMEDIFYLGDTVNGESCHETQAVIEPAPLLKSLKQVIKIKNPLTLLPLTTPITNSVVDGTHKKLAKSTATKKFPLIPWQNGARPLHYLSSMSMKLGGSNGYIKYYHCDERRQGIVYLSYNFCFFFDTETYSPSFMHSNPTQLKSLKHIGSIMSILLHFRWMMKAFFDNVKEIQRNFLKTVLSKILSWRARTKTLKRKAKSIPFRISLARTDCSFHSCLLNSQDTCFCQNKRVTCKKTEPTKNLHQHLGEIFFYFSSNSDFTLILSTMESVSWLRPKFHVLKGFINSATLCSEGWHCKEAHLQFISPGPLFWINVMQNGLKLWCENFKKKQKKSQKKAPIS
ncbi:hypothetical protein VP01_5707g1, partial [Puccinia sorghi]